MPSANQAPNLDRLLAIMARLRHPTEGCPWDREQTFRSIAPYTIEEAYEVAEAIERNDIEGLREELGDLLLQVVYHARMAEEAGHFAFDEVAAAIADKMVARHPHVFADAPMPTLAGYGRTWEAYKAEERRRKAARHGGPASVLDDVPHALPALVRAEKLQKRAARVGFDWPEPAQVLDKMSEEIGELREALAGQNNRDALAEEIGDLLFCLANLARHVGVDAEDALRRCNAKFERRFRRIEALLAARGRQPQDATLDELEALWLQAKSEERRDAAE